MEKERLQIGYLEVQNRPMVNGTGVLLSGEAYPASNPSGYTRNQNVVYTTGNQNISGLKRFVNNRTEFGGASIGKVIISDDTFGDEIGILTEYDETIAVKMTDGSFEYGGGAPGSSPLSFLNEVGNFNNRPTVNGTGVLLQGEAAGGSIENVVYTTGNQTISGVKTFTNNTDFQQDISVSGFYNFDITNTGEPLDGQMIWNADYGTAQIGMDNGNVINPIGFKSFYRVKAAETIRKGKVVMALGGVGNSEYILAREAQNIANSGQLIMGVSAEEILANNYGDVVAFGSVRGVNTSDYPQDSILYYDTSSTGEFTNIPPQPPNAKVLVALNTTSANNGIAFVRVTAGSELGGTDSNVKFSALQDNDFIKYNSASGYWENKQLTTGDVSGIDSYYLTSNPSGYITGIDLSNYYTNDNPSGFITGIQKETKLFDYVTTGIPIYMYVGSAPFGSSQNDNIWDIYRTEIDQNGLVVANLLATNVAWTGRFLENYM